MLPLDLHVLGLPLAFILSQDQTLHSKNVKLSPEILRHPKVPRNPNSSCALISLTSKKINVKLLFQHQRQPHRWSRRRSLLFILVLHCNTSKNVISFSRFAWKRNAKICQLFQSTKKTFRFFASPLSRGPFFRDCGCKGNDLFGFRKHF